MMDWAKFGQQLMRGPSCWVEAGTWIAAVVVQDLGSSLGSASYLLLHPNILPAPPARHIWNFKLNRPAGWALPLLHHLGEYFSIKFWLSHCVPFLSNIYTRSSLSLNLNLSWVNQKMSFSFIKYSKCFHKIILVRFLLSELEWNSLTDLQCNKL